jgi:hypothetical protein
MQANLPTLCINCDFIPGLDQGQRPSDRSFRGYMSDHETVTAAGKASVGNQRDL